MESFVSPLFLEKAREEHRKPKSVLVRINHFECEDSNKINSLFEEIFGDEGNLYPHERFLSVIVFYSNLFRMSCLSENPFVLDKQAIDSILGEWVSFSKAPSFKYEEYCICGHDVLNPVFIQNTLNGNILRVSTVCVKNYLHPIMKEAVSVIEKHRRYQGEFRICGNCFNPKIPPAENSREICPDCHNSGHSEIKECFKIAMLYRSCNNCGEFNIPGRYPCNQNRCKNCQEERKCDTCGVIIDYQDERKKKCLPCFTKSLGYVNTSSSSYPPNSTEKVKCPKCGMMKIPANKAHIFKVCFTCK